MRYKNIWCKRETFSRDSSIYGSCSNTDKPNGDDQIQMTLCDRRLSRKNQWIFTVTVFGHELAAKRAILLATSNETKKNLRGNDISSNLRRTRLYRSSLYKGFGERERVSVCVLSKYIGCVDKSAREERNREARIFRRVEDRKISLN